MIGSNDSAVPMPMAPTHTGSSNKPVVDANILIAGLNATLGSDSAASDGCPLKLPSDAPISISAFPHQCFHQIQGIGR
jgi:hypothetical protein